MEVNSMNPKTVAICLAVVIFASVLAASAILTTGESGTSEVTVFLVPLYANVRVNQTFVANISVSGVSDLYGWEFKLGYNTSLLDLVNITEGSFFNNIRDTYFVPKNISTDGYILAGCTSLRNVAGVSGNGTLATVEFRSRALGSCALDMYDTKLVDSAKQLMNHSEIDGTVTASGCITVRVQYADGFPRSGADVTIVTPNYYLGITGEDGIMTNCDHDLSEGDYSVKALFSGSQFGPNTYLHVDSNGDGSCTITNWNLEITPPVITLLCPKNQTYAGRLVPLNFTIYDYSAISWMGYSLDGQANTTVTGNVTLNVNAGSHSIVVYANDTYGNMGNSDIVHFSSLGGWVVIRVQYLDGYPVYLAQVNIWYEVGKLNKIDSGNTNRNGFFSDTLPVYPHQYWVEVRQGGIEKDFLPVNVDENCIGWATSTLQEEITPPAIQILSPQNSSYYVSAPLVFTVYDFSPISWMGYSLDGQANVTITGNTTLAGLSNGSHSIVVYAVDAAGNMGSSAIISFEVEAASQNGGGGGGKMHYMN